MKGFALIIADACNNHLGDMRIIERMIELCPADFIKFQLFDPNELSREWRGEYEYYRLHALSDDMVLRIIRLCDSKNITPMFTLFSRSQIARAKHLGVVWVKIASPNACDLSFVHDVVAEFDEVTISDGMLHEKDKRCINYVAPNATFLHCISRYPAIWTEEEKNKALSMDGISDHSDNIDTAIWAVRNGLWVERHYTLGKDLPGKDHKISSTPDEFRKIVAERDYLKNIERYKNRWTGGSTMKIGS